MERVVWLHDMRNMTESLYDHFAPLYWMKYGKTISESHARFLLKFLGQVVSGSHLLSAGCGAGLYDGLLLEAGHNVVGIDLSDGMLARAQVRFPEIRYKKMGMQEMDFQDEFDGVICIDALEHVFPEDWPLIVHGFQAALKPGGMLYFTLDVRETDELEAAYQLAKSQGLPVVFGEVADEVEIIYAKVMRNEDIPDELLDKAVYHYCPAVEQVREWLAGEGFVIEVEEMGEWYRHILARKA